MGPIKLKQRLLTFAKNGGDRTKLSAKIKARLRSYMFFKNSCYDVEFCRDLMKIAPQWFKNHCETEPGVDARKQHMLECAATGMSRIAYSKAYGSIGLSYIGKSNSYDPVFTAKLFEIAPAWNVKKRVKLNKEKLLAFAKSGAELPANNTVIRATLNNYTRFEYKCFDPAFRKQIEQLRPEWFGA